MSKIKAGFLIGIFVLVVAFLGPTLIESPDSRTNQTLQLEQGEAREVTDGLEINATRINSTTPDADILLKNTETLNRSAIYLDPGNHSSNKTVLDGNNVTVHWSDALTNNTLIVTVDHSPLFGYADGPRQFIEYTPLLFVLIAVVMIILLVFVAIRQ